MKSVRDDIKEEDDVEEKATLKAYLVTLKEKIKEANTAVTAAAELTVNDYYLAEQKEAAARRKQEEDEAAAAAAINVDTLVDTSPIEVVIESPQPSAPASAKRSASRAKPDDATPVTPDTTDAPRSAKSSAKRKKNDRGSFERTSSGRGAAVVAKKALEKTSDEGSNKKKGKAKSRRSNRKSESEGVETDGVDDDWEEDPVAEGIVLSLKRKRTPRSGSEEVSMPLACVTWIV